MFISDDDIYRVKKGEIFQNKYLHSVKAKGKKTIGSIHRIKKRLKKIAFDTYEDYLKFRILMNIKEADRCYRMRMISDTSQTFVCDNCVGRCICFFQVPDICQYFKEGNIKESYISNDDSELVQDQIQYCENNNITPIFFPRVIDIFYFKNLLNNSPLHCLATPVKIIEPRFDIFYGMEEFANIGIMIDNMRKKEWEKLNE